jgi:hypothetical protein
LRLRLREPGGRARGPGRQVSRRATAVLTGLLDFLDGKTVGEL